MVENKISTTIAVEGTIGILVSAREKENIDPKFWFKQFAPIKEHVVNCHTLSKDGAKTIRIYNVKLCSV